MADGQTIGNPSTSSGGTLRLPLPPTTLCSFCCHLVVHLDPEVDVIVSGHVRPAHKKTEDFLSTGSLPFPQSLLQSQRLSLTLAFYRARSSLMIRCVKSLCQPTQRVSRL
jgi:hypothetical protein